MSRQTVMLLVIAIGASGCTRSYRVYVSGYSELNEPIPKSAPIYVRTDPNGANPILDRQVKAKTQRLLRLYDYSVAVTPAEAQYELGFEMGMQVGQTVSYAPVRGMYGGSYSYFPRRGFGLGLGYSTYVPRIDQQHNQWLVLRLFKPNAEEADQNELIWVGEAAMNMPRASLRQAVDYLLIGAVDILGVDTASQLSMVIKADDPRLADLAAGPQ